MFNVQRLMFNAQVEPLFLSIKLIKMDTSAFAINFPYKDGLIAVEIRPCCREDNIVDYAVYENDKLVFTVTPSMDNADHWVIALKNADDQFDDDLVQAIGAQIRAKETKT